MKVSELTAEMERAVELLYPFSGWVQVETTKFTYDEKMRKFSLKIERDYIHSYRNITREILRNWWNKPIDIDKLEFESDRVRHYPVIDGRRQVWYLLERVDPDHPDRSPGNLDTLAKLILPVLKPGLIGGPVILLGDEPLLTNEVDRMCFLAEYDKLLSKKRGTS